VKFVDVLFSFCYLVFLVQSHEAEEEAATGRGRVMTLQENSSDIFCNSQDLLLPSEPKVSEYILVSIGVSNFLLR
jgi:hypothetical protein